MSKTINIQEGQSWFTRAGDLITIINTSGSGDFPVWGICNRRVIHKYTKDGCTVGKGFIRDTDLIKLK